MNNTLKYSVNGQVVDVPQNENSQFLASAKERGITPDSVGTYRVKTEDGTITDVDVPNSQYNDFFSQAQKRNALVEPTRTVTMSDGTRRNFTMPEMARYLRSDEYKQSADYKGGGEQGSVALAGTIGALKGFAQGAYQGAQAASNKLAKVIPETGIAVESAIGNMIGGSAGEYLKRSAADSKAWLDAKLPSETKDWTGYEDWSTKTADKVGEVASVAAKFAPAMATGGASLMETVFAVDGINAAGSTFDNALANGYSVEDANKAAMASFLVNYFGGKAMVKAGGMTAGMNPALAFLGGGAAVGNVMGLQGAANKGIENLTAGKDGRPAPKPFTEGMGEAYMEGQVEGNLFHYMNSAPGMVYKGARSIYDGRAAREMYKESVLEASDTRAGRELLAVGIDAKKLVSALEKDGKISRKIGKEANLPDNMSSEERNSIAAKFADDVKSGQKIPDMVDPLAVEQGKLDARNERRAVEAKMADNEHKAQSERGVAERAERKAGMEEYERAEAERKAREAAEERRGVIEDEVAGAIEDIRGRIAKRDADEAYAEVNSAPKPRTEEYSEYASWLKKRGRVDSDKNWNKFVAENELDPALKAKRGTPEKLVETEAATNEAKETPVNAEENTRQVKPSAGEAAPEMVRNSAEATRESMKDDPMLIRLDATYKKAQTDVERNAIMEKFKERIAELRKGIAENKPQETKVEDVVSEPREPIAEAFKNATVDQLVAHLNDSKSALKGAVLDELNRRGLDKDGKPVAKDEGAETKVPDGKDKMVEKPIATKVEEVSQAAAKSAESPKSAKTSEASAYKSNTPNNSDNQDGLRKPINTAEYSVRKNEKTGRYEVVDSIGKVVQGKSTLPHTPLSSKSKTEAEWMLKEYIRGIDNVNTNMNGSHEIVPGESAKNLKAEEKSAKARLKSEREEIIADIDATMKNEIERAENKGIIELYRKQISEAEKSGEKKRAKTLEEYLLKELDMVSFGKDGIVFKVPNSNARYTVYTAKGLEILRRSVAKNYGKEASKRYYEENINLSRTPESDITDRLDLNRINPTDRKSADAIRWAKKHGYTVSDGMATPEALREFHYAQANAAAKIARRWFPNMNIVVHKYGEGIKRGEHVLDQISEKEDVAYADAVKRGDMETARRMVREAAIKSGYDESAVSIAVHPEDAFDDAGNVIPLSERFSAKNNDIRYLRDTSGRSLGWFDPNSKEVHLLPGANAETVAHEIMWHGTRDWATTEAAKSNEEAKRLLNKMHEVEAAVPESLKRQIKELYKRHGVSDPDTLLNEYGAWDAMVNGGKALRKEIKTREDMRWYARWWAAAKDLVKAFLSKHGGNRADFSEIDDMTTEEFKDFLAEQFAGGKTLGEFDGITKAKNQISTEESWMQKQRRKRYDVNTPLRDLERDIEKKTGRKITDEESAEAENARTPGLREAALIQTRNAENDLREYLGGKNEHAKKLNSQDLEYYLALKAAAGRDAKIDARNIAKLMDEVERIMRAKWGADAITRDPDGFKTAVDEAQVEATKNYKSVNGSHIKPVEAKGMIAELEGGENGQLYKDAAKLVRKTIDETLELQVQAGLVSREVADKLRAEEPNYIPFKNEFEADSGEYIGRGTNNFNKPEFYMAKGRVSAAGDILTHIFQDNLNARQRLIENGVRERLAKLVKSNPEVGSVERLGEITRNPQKVLSDKKDPNNTSGDPNVVIFKRNGDSYAIRLNGTRGSAIASAITERNTKSANKIFGAISRFQAGLATRYAPYFSLRNFPKDNIELANIIFSERGPIEGTKWAAKYVANHAKNAKAISKYIMTGKFDESTAAGKIVADWVRAGGVISGGATEGYANIKKSLTPEAIEAEIKRGASKTWAAAKAVQRAVLFANELSELSTRINVFATEIESGKSAKEAALFARRATVDFNRHGENTALTNTLRLFSNSTLGASARSIAALTKSKYGIATLSASFGLGVLQEVVNKYLNTDWDEEAKTTGKGSGKDVSEYERKASWFSIRKGDRVFKIAQHESPFSLANYAGQCFVRVLNRDMTAKKAAEELGVSASELAITLTGWGSVNLRSSKGGLANDAMAALVSATPSLFQPLAEIASDIDYKGDPLTRKRIGEETPKSELGRTHTAEWAKDTAKSINRAAGGNDARSSYLDVYPETLQKLVEGYGKNAAREIAMTMETAKAIFNGTTPDLDVRRIPIARDIVRPVDGNTTRYFDAKRQYLADKTDYNKHKSSWSATERKKYLDSHPWVKKVGESRKVDRLIDGFHNGARHVPGIDDLMKMEQGFIRKRSGGFVAHDWTSEEKAEFKRQRLEKQAKVLEIMGL